ncbi:hypothetical protein LAZ67_13001002 [Cordylochernes scorpioides]|uniref:Ig-like domain-containing protein n=1 Tax=Cordylochernes scorpioides TaxID=51811 RepID=A0ABY6L3G9_9ARAC|nr:hypothetical protein LAZ67_13001002 [Cordylochernes scorpioides]
MKVGTRAERLVKIYPLTEANYPKVKEALKDRFGDKVILTEVYVRQLLKLVINNTTKKLNVAQVSWIRRRDLHLLTVGPDTYTTDERFQTTLIEPAQDWVLQLKYVHQRDAGLYECQLSADPKISYFFNLTVLDPPFSENEVKLTAFKFWKRKSPGPEGIDNTVVNALGLKLEEETIRQKIWDNREDALGLEAGTLESKRDPRKPPQWLPKWNCSPGGLTGIGTKVFTDCSLEPMCTELVAIRVALRVCAEKNFSPDRLYSDCMSALVAINLEKGQLAHQIIQELEMITRAPELPWFRRHSLTEALQKFDIDPEQQLYTPKIVDIAAAAAVIEMHGDI